MARQPKSRFLVDEQLRRRSQLGMANGFLDAASGAVRAKLPSCQAENAVKAQLGPNNSTGSDGRPAVVPVREERRILKRY